MKVFCFVFLVALLSIKGAYADIVNEYVEVACRPELNALTVSHKSVNGTFAENAFKSKAKQLKEKYGLIDLMALFDIAPDFSSQQEKKYRMQCHLQTPDADEKTYKPLVLDITLEGIAQNPNPEGECGGWRSFSLTVSNGRNIYIDHLPFDENCGSDRRVQEAEFNAQEGYINVNTSHKTEKNTFWINDGRLQTVTRDIIYPNYDLYGERAGPW